jgi:sec-independent protein translocase protein TatB
MFNIGFTELILLGMIALIFIGPSQLPEVARTLGRLLNEWKRATSDFQSTLTTHITDDLHERRKTIHAASPVDPTAVEEPPVPVDVPDPENKS